MKFSEKWLRTWVNPDIDSTQLCEQLTMSGLEVESITNVTSKFQGVVIGQVLSVNKHPSADRLNVCQVNIGDPQFLNIVCGASNVRAGLKVPVALVNATLPDGTKIKKAKLRGVESTGMICSEKELGFLEESSGIMELPQEAPFGIKLDEYLSLADNIIELNITPNRGDCLSICGIAREVAAINNCNINVPSLIEPKIATDKSCDVKIMAKDACPHYLGCVVSNINNKVKVPFWLRERLESSGLRSVNPVVDVLNYVMMELGQPMHAFDLAKIDGAIYVRFAEQNETIKLLNNETLNLRSEDLIIADQKKPIALAGIMGSSIAEVNFDTTDIFLESAFFAPEFIFESVKQYGLTSEAAHRFERYVDPALQNTALLRALELLVNLVGGSIGHIKKNPEEYLPKQNSIILRRERCKRILGVNFPDNIITNILQRLHMQVLPNNEGWMVVPPSYRVDLNIEVDLIEEIARIYGYDHIKPMPIILPLRNKERNPSDDLFLENCRQLKSILRDQGYREVINYSFIDTKMQEQFDSSEKPILLANPISKDFAALRTSLWPGLIKVVIHNQNRQHERMRFFEIGLRFLSSDKGLPKQSNMLAGVIVGDIYPLEWGAPKREVDFFDLKRDVENLINLFAGARKKTLQFKVETHPTLHPGICARIYLDGEPIGFIGRLHPRLNKLLSINNEIYLFELDLSFFNAAVDLKFKSISKFPFVQRDLAIMLDEKISWFKIAQTISNCIGGEVLQDVELFDIYRGNGVIKGQKSFALRLTFQHKAKTLTEEEIETFMQKIMDILLKELNVQIRG